MNPSSDACDDALYALKHVYLFGHIWDMAQYCVYRTNPLKESVYQTVREYDELDAEHTVEHAKKRLLRRFGLEPVRLETPLRSLSPECTDIETVLTVAIPFSGSPEILTHPDTVGPQLRIAADKRALDTIPTGHITFDISFPHQDKAIFDAEIAQHVAEILRQVTANNATVKKHNASLSVELDLLVPAAIAKLERERKLAD